ncbi:hypothetical protein LCGC14_2097430 [marine sediment metagenome]|uniref:Terminase small subunit n=1 Tax=marine sediment metagenome TaxID=412755 RepID=A0A0F9H7F1_9ZZZZ
MTTEVRKLTPKRLEFCRQYLKDLNATAAARRAGYAVKNADVEGPRLLGFAGVQREIARLRLELQSRTQVSPEKIVRELALIAFSDIGDVIRFVDGAAHLDFSDLPPEFTKSVSQITVETFTEGRGDRATDIRQVKLKMNDKRAALVDLAKIMGMMREQVDVNITSDHDAADFEDVSDDDLRAFIERRREGVAAVSQDVEVVARELPDDAREEVSDVVPDQ